MNWKNKEKLNNAIMNLNYEDGDKVGGFLVRVKYLEDSDVPFMNLKEARRDVVRIIELGGRTTIPQRLDSYNVF